MRKPSFVTTLAKITNERNTRIVSFAYFIFCVFSLFVILVMILDIQMALFLGAFVIVVCLSGYILWLVLRGTRPAVASTEYVLSFPPKKKEIRNARSLEAAIFKKCALLPRSTVDKWLGKNEAILTCLTKGREVVGYVEVVPITSEFAEGFERGEFTEKDITDQCILSFRERKQVKHLYIAGIVVKDYQAVDLRTAATRAAILEFAVQKQILAFYDLSKLEKIYVMPVTEDGTRFVKQSWYGFTQVQTSGLFMLTQDRIHEIAASKRFSSHKATKEKANFSVYQKYLDAFLE